MRCRIKLKSIFLALSCFITISFSTAQDCNEINFVGLANGPLPTMGGFVIAEYGSPIVQDVQCEPGADPKSARMQCDLGVPGDGIRYTTSFGINPVPTFEAGKTYEYSFLKFINDESSMDEVEIRVKATNVNLTSFDDCPAGDCEIIKTAAIGTTQGICDDSWYGMTYTPSQTFEHMVFSVRQLTDFGTVWVNIDKICVGELQECSAEFTFQVDECGELCTTNQSQGTGLSYLWTVQGPSGYFFTSTSVDFCEQLPSNGNYSISLSVQDGSGCTDEFGESFIVDIIDVVPPVIDCWDDITLSVGITPDCVTDYTFPDIEVSEISDFTMTCTIDGMNVTGGQVVTLSEGSHQVTCLAIDECENISDTCNFLIVVECDTLTECIEDFESYATTPLMNSVGNWQTVNGDVAFYQDPTIANGTIVLRGKDDSGGSYMSNITDFSGDWTDEGCELCFDIRYDPVNTNNAQTGIYAIYLYQNSISNPTNVRPPSAPIWARFKVNNPIGNQWTKVCVPTSLSNGVQLPGNGYGDWFNPTPSDWDNLIQNVSGIGFNLDFASGPNPSEELFVDNFCFEPCPTEIDTCGYTCCLNGPNMDIENMSLGALGNSNPSGWYNEYGGPTIANTGCNGSQQGIELDGASFAFAGDAAGYRINGPIGPENIFEKDKTYCISFCARFDEGAGTTAADLTIKATDSSPQLSTPCSGNCEVIDIVTNPTNGTWTDFQIIYTPNNDYTNLVFANGSAGPIDVPPIIYIDEVCVSEAIPIVNDTIPPVVTCPMDQLIIGIDGINGCVASYTVPNITATDNGGIDTIICDIDGISVTAGQSITLDALNPHILTCIAVDICGNADTCTSTITVFCEPSGSCDPNCESVFSINLSTGVDALGNKIPSGLGVIDPQWRLINSPLVLNCTNPLQSSLDGSAYLTNWVHPSTTAWVNIPGVSVISPYDQGNSLGFGCNNNVNQQGQRIPYIFERTFCLCENAGVDLNLDFKGDDQVRLELWNLSTNTMIAVSNTYTYWSPTANWSQSFALPAGNYAIRAFLVNTNATTLGFAINGGITLQNLEEPLLNNIGECCSNENLAVRKILDLDCTETNTPGDQLGVGWTFNLSQGGSIVASGITNINGEVIFSGLTPGTYNLSEVTQPGYQLAKPLGNNLTVTITQGGFHVVEFYNCPQPPVDCDSLMVMISDPMCIDSSIITGLPCTFEFDPVCGCDGNTYSNACIAQESGVTVVNTGECNGNNTPELPGGCCYNVDLKNNWGNSITEVEVKMLTPGWIFNSVNLTHPFTFGSCPTMNDRFCVQASSGSIPDGSNRAMSFCLANTDPMAASTQMVEFAWKQMVNEEEFIVCKDTVLFECDVPEPDTCFAISDVDANCDPEDPYQYDVCFKVENKSNFPINYITLEDLDPNTFGFLPGPTTSKVVFLLPNPLPHNTISNTICITVRSQLPILQPDSLYMNFGAVNTTEDTCCHDAVRLCVPIEPCCDPCDQKELTYSKIDAREGECCYAVDISNDCEYDYFSKIEFDLKTSGVCFGSHVMNPAFSSQFNITTTSNNICVTPRSGYLPKGVYTDFIKFCLDKIDDPSKDFPIIEVKWHTTDPLTGESMVACMDSIITDCESPDDNICLMVMDQVIECVPDSNKYRYTFTVTNKSNPRFVADKLHLFVKNDPANWIPVPTGNIIPLPMPIDSGQSVTLTTCLMGPNFPATFNDFIFSYRLQGVNPTDCCFESVCDTIPVPPCEPSDSLCCDITEEAFCEVFDQAVTPTMLSLCEACWDFSSIDSCDVLEISVDQGPFAPVGDSTYCVDDLSDGFHTLCFVMERYDENGEVCIFKDSCYEIFIECPPVDSTCCDITEEDYKTFVLNNLSLSPVDCEACINLNLDTCDNVLMKWEDSGSLFQPNLNGTTCNTYPTPGGTFNITFSAWRSDPNMPGQLCVRFDTVFTIIVECEIDSSICPSCPMGTIPVNNLIVNGDFENGKVGFTSGYAPSTLTTGTGEFDVKSGSVFSTTDPQWVQNDHTLGTIFGKMLVANGPLPNSPAWSQTVNVVEGNSYVFCAWVNNLIAHDQPNNGPPMVEVIINGSTVLVPVTPINVLPDDWVLVTGTWVAPSGTTAATIEIFNRQIVEDADLAIDDISFVECEIPPSVCCTDQMRFDSLVNIGWQVIIDECDVTVFAPQFDTCHWFGTLGPDWGDDSGTLPAITPAVPVQTFTHTYTSSGTYNICITVFEGDDIDNSCWNAQLCTPVTVNCCDEDPCELTDIMVSPNSTSNDSCCYEVTIDNQYCKLNYFKGFRIDITTGSSISSVKGLNGYIINQINSTSAEVFHPSGFVPQGIEAAFEVCGNGMSGINFTISWLVPDGQGGCEAICEENFTRDCGFDDPRCVFILEDSIQCDSNQYCFRIKNNSYPGFTINSIDLIGLTPTGASLLPNPISIPSLAPGDTSDWICLTYSGVSVGDNVCFFVIGHDTDITMNEPPLNCCADTVQHCFEVPDCPGGGDCCDITQDSLENMLEMISLDIDTANCEVCVDVLTDDCTSMGLLFGNDFFAFDPNSDTTFCYGFDPGLNIGSVILEMHRIDANGDTCLTAFNVEDYEFECPPEDCCDDVTQEDFDEFFETFIDEFIELDTCEICVEVDFDGCNAALILGYGDGVIDTLDESGTYCHTYNGPGPWNLDVALQLFRNDGTICIEGDSTYMIDVPDCPISMGEPCCDNINLDSIGMAIDDALDQIEFMDCTICIPIVTDSCDLVEINWGDNTSSQFVGDSTICHTYTQDSLYDIQVSIYRLDNQGNICIDTTVMRSITIEECDAESDFCNPSNITIYNAVSPNGDNLNEYLELIVPNECGQVDISIYNRWGQLVWSEENYQNNWDGQSDLERDLPDGTYYLILALPDAKDEDGKSIKALNTFIDLRRDR